MIQIKLKEIDEIAARNKRASAYLTRKEAEARLARLHRASKIQDVLLFLAAVAALAGAAYLLHHNLCDFAFEIAECILFFFR